MGAPPPDEPPPPDSSDDPSNAALDNDAELGRRLSDTLRDDKCCCCSLSIKRRADIVMSISLILVLVNFLMKATGHSDTDWNYELLFLVVDSVAVASLFFGIRREAAPFLQPFVMLNFITISFLILLTIFFATAVYDLHSYAGEYLEMELRENIQSYATFLGVNQRTVVPLVGGVLSMGASIGLLFNSWFLHVVVRCAQYFRVLEKQRYSRDESSSLNSVVSR